MSVSPLERFRRIDYVFDAALDLPPPERQAFVDREFAEDPDLRAEAHQLLAAHERSAGFLESPAVRMAATLLPEGNALLSPEPAAPARVGAFRVVRELGRGGMGAVFLAERDDGQFAQRVALKLVHNAGTTRRLVRGLLEERRILAMLEHPGIARLIDGGVTSDGLPYFAMEYVEGEPVDRYCAVHALSIEQRLDLFGRVCDAVEYAHQHLIVHRDLKPSNILVTAEGQPRLLDFGIARLLGTARLELGATAATETLTAHAMTPAYAAPEQIRGEPVSTGTDLYALGLLLYELLSGARAYDLDGRTAAEVERIVCTVEPVPPSTRAKDEAARRRLRGDLDVIVLKALRKDARDRYASAAALRDDLRRYRDGLPIVARPHSAAYRLRKFVVRRRGAVAAAAVLALVLTAATGRERVLRASAEAESQKARAVEDYLVSVFDVADPFAIRPETGEAVTARALLDRGAERLDEQLAGQPAAHAEMLGVFGRVYTNLGLYDRAVPVLERAVTERRALYGDDHPDVADALDALGVAFTRQDRLDEAEPLLRDALERRRRTLGSVSIATAASLENLATLLQQRNDFESAEPLFRESLEIRRAVAGPADLDAAAALTKLALLRWWRGDYAAADSLYREALEIETEALGEEHPRTAQTLHNIAQAQQMLGNVDDAVALYRRALDAKRRTLGNAHPSVTVNLNNLGRLLAMQGRLDEAEPLIREALSLDREIFGDRHSYVGQSLTNLNLVLRSKGEFDEAERAAAEALEINRALYGTEHNFIALNLNDIAGIRYSRGDPAGAVPFYRESADMYGRLLGPGHLSTITLRNNLARALVETGAAEEALGLLRANLEQIDTASASHRPARVMALATLGLALKAERRCVEARPIQDTAVRLAAAQYGADHWRTAEAELGLAECMLETGEADAADGIVRRAHIALQSQTRSQPRLAQRAADAVVKLDRLRARR